LGLWGVFFFLVFLCDSVLFDVWFLLWVFVFMGAVFFVSFFLFWVWLLFLVRCEIFCTLGDWLAGVSRDFFGVLIIVVSLSVLI